MIADIPCQAAPTAASPRHEIRIGQQKTQFGCDGRESSSRLLAVNRTEVSGDLFPGITLRDIGIGLLGNVPIWDRFRFADAVTLTNGARPNEQDDNTDMKDEWGRLDIRYKTDDVWIGLGASGAIGNVGPKNFDEVRGDDKLYLWSQVRF